VHACAGAPRLKVFVYGKAVEAGRVGRRPLRCTQAAKVTSRRGPRPAVNDTSRIREGDGVTARRIAARPWVVCPSTGAGGRNLPRFPSLWVPHVADTRTEDSKDSIKQSIGPGTRLFPRGPPPAHCRVSGIPRTGDPDSRIFILGGAFRFLTRTCRSTVGRSECELPRAAHANRARGQRAQLSSRILHPTAMRWPPVYSAPVQSPSVAADSPDHACYGLPHRAF